LSKYVLIWCDWKSRLNWTSKEES